MSAMDFYQDRRYSQPTKPLNPSTTGPILFGSEAAAVSNHFWIYFNIYDPGIHVNARILEKLINSARS